jgi:hypothetical protein
LGGLGWPDLKASVFLSLQSMLVLNVVGKLQSHIISTWHATASNTETCAAFFKECMHAHFAGPEEHENLYWHHCQVQTIGKSKMLAIACIVI